MKKKPERALAASSGGSEAVTSQEATSAPTSEAGTNTPSTEKGKPKSSIFRRNKGTRDDKSKKGKPEKKDKPESLVPEKKSWSRFFSTRASKRKKQKDNNDVSKICDTLDDAVGSRDLSLQLSEAACAPSISKLTAPPAHSDAVSSIVLRQSDFTSHELETRSANSQVETKDKVSGLVQNLFDLDTARGSCQLEITPNNRLLTQEVADKSSYSDARSSPGNKAEGRGGVIPSSGGDDPRFCVPHTEHEVLHGRGLGNVSNHVNGNLPITVLDRSPGVRHRETSPESRQHLSTHPPGPPHTKREEQGERTLLDSRGLSRSRLHITHLSSAIEDIRDVDLGITPSLRSVDVESVPLELSFSGSSRRLLVGERNVSLTGDDPSSSHHAPTYIGKETENENQLCLELMNSRDKMVCKDNWESDENSALRVRPGGILEEHQEKSGQLPKTISTQTASLPHTDATTQSTIDRRADRRGGGDAQTTHVADVATQSTIDRRHGQGHPRPVEVTDTTTQWTIDRRTTRHHAPDSQTSPSQSPAQERHCSNCQALQRPCHKHRLSNRQTGSQSASRHLDSAESYLQLLSDIHRMHHTTRDAVTPSVDEATNLTVASPTDSRSRSINAGDDQHSSNMIPTNERRHNHPANHSQIPPFVRSFRGQRDNYRSRDRGSANRGSHRKPLEKDDNMKDMPVATVKPTVRSELAGARTSGRGSRVRQDGAATDAARNEPGQRLEPPTTNAAGRGHRQRMEPSSSGAARQRLDPSSSRISEIPPLTARANPFTTMSNPLTARSNQLTARSNRITGEPIATTETDSIVGQGAGLVSPTERRVSVDRESDLTLSEAIGVRPWEIARERARERVREYRRERYRMHEVPSSEGVSNHTDVTQMASIPASVQQNQVNRPTTHPAPTPVPPVSEVSVYRLLGQVQDDLVRIPGVLIVGIRDERIFVTVAPSEGEQRIPEVLRVLLQHGVATSQCEVGVLPQSLRTAITAFTDDDVIQRLGDHEPLMLAVN